MIGFYFKYIFAKMISFLGFFIGKKRDVIIIKLDRLGDYILWQECARQIQESYKDRKITLLCSPVNAEIALESKIFDEIIIIKSLPKNLKDIIRLKAQTIINPTYSRNNRMELVTFAISAKKRIAIKSDCSNYKEKERNFWEKQYSIVLDIGEKVIPEYERNQLFVNSLLKKNSIAKLADLSNMIDNRFIDDEYVVINLGASDISRCWPIDRFATVMEHIYEKTNLKCVLIGGQNEIDYSTKFCEMYHKEVEVFTGKTSIRQMITIVAYARLLLTNDTSTVHIAAACGVECICISPGTTFPRFSIYEGEKISGDSVLPKSIYKIQPCFGCDLEKGRDKKLDCCIEAQKNGLPIKCIDEIKVEDVIDIIDEWIEMENIYGKN